jgi:ABC-type phosphate transport system substrate-binding protein
MHLLQTQRPGINRQVIIYSLNDKDIKRYTNEEVSAIFSAE